jgi:cytochrome P450
MDSRTDVVELSVEQMSPALRSLILYERNGALDRTAPQPILDKIRRTTPVVRWELGVGFFGMEDVRAACRNPDLVSMNPETGVNFGMGSPSPLIPLHLDGARHLRFRKLLAPLFARRKMALLEPAIRSLADRLIDAFIAEGRADLYEQFCVPLPSIVFLRLFGMPLADLPSLTDWKDRILKSNAPDRDQQEAIGLEAGAEMDEHLRDRLRERIALGSRHDDLLDAFIHLEVDGQRLPEDDVVNIMHMFTIAGLDTVTSSLSCIIGWLATHPAERRRIVADPSLLERAVEELLRHQSPVHSGGARWAARDTDINGVLIRKGQMVYVCWATANLDPAYFEKPMEPNFDRHYVPHVAFAVGTHHCLGSHLARTELIFAIDQLHRRIPDYRVMDGKQIRWEHASVRQAKRLPLQFEQA